MSVGDAKAVLLVEDDIDVREAVADTLDEAGYRVSPARNGQEALDMLRSGAVQPRVILLDLMMPVMDGWQFREEQLRDPALASIPVVALSAHVCATEPQTPTRLLADLGDTLHRRFGIDHITIQVEPEGFAECAGCGASAAAGARV